jgi:hypothetical protein
VMCAKDVLCVVICAKDVLCVVICVAVDSGLWVVIELGWVNDRFNWGL